MPASMTGRSWFETRKVPLITNLKNRVRGLTVVMGKPATTDAERAIFEAEKTTLEAEIARRVATPAFHVDVRHIGSEDNPNETDALEAAENHAYELARLRARKHVRDAGDAASVAREISVLASNDPEWVRFQSEHAKRWIEAGLTGGAEEYRRLVRLGGAALLADAVVEVKAWQRIGFDQGEG